MSSRPLQPPRLLVLLFVCGLGGVAWASDRMESETLH